MYDKIRNIDVYLVSSAILEGIADSTRKVESVGFLIVRVETEQGLEGVGLTYHEVGGNAMRVLIEHDIVPLLIGRDPLETEVIWQDIVQHLRGVGRKGLLFCAVSAIDIALWDIKAKSFSVPLYLLFGGNKTRIPVYASGGWTSYTDDELVEEMVGMRQAGYSAVKFKVGVEGGGNLRRDAMRVRKVREALGPDIGLMVDANNAFDAASAVKLANMIREFDILFFEEPVPADDIPGLARFRCSTDVPLATGEHEYTKHGVRDLLLAGAADVVQVDGTRVGGYTEILKCAAMTQAWNVKLAPHAMENIHAHLVAAMPNVPFLERLLMFEDLTSKTFVDAPRPVDGVMELSDVPGIGLELNMDFIASQKD